jgi:hypothetical protein
MLCEAKTRSGLSCQKYGMVNGKCRLHGGLSLSGQQHPNFKHGRRSKAYIENARRVRLELCLLGHLGRAYGLFVK